MTEDRTATGWDALDGADSAPWTFLDTLILPLFFGALAAFALISFFGSLLAIPLFPFWWVFVGRRRARERRDFVEAVRAVKDSLDAKRD